jgi:hypothetical protein
MAGELSEPMQGTLRGLEFTRISKEGAIGSSVEGAPVNRHDGHGVVEPCADRKAAEPRLVVADGADVSHNGPPVHHSGIVACCVRNWSYWIPCRARKACRT